MESSDDEDDDEFFTPPQSPILDFLDDSDPKILHDNYIFGLVLNFIHCF